MALSIPSKSSGDLLTAAEFNELLAAVNDFVDDNFSITLAQVSDLAVTGTTKISVQSSAPASPNVGDVWINT